MRGIGEPVLAPADDAATLEAPLALVLFGESERPGATADTSAANPAVSTAAPAITQRRVRLTRASAASRIKTARDRSDWFPRFDVTSRTGNQRSVRAA
jgi:hypothetical protein